MRTFIECVPCFFRQTTEALRAAGVDNGRLEDVTREVAALVSRFDFNNSPVAISRDLHRIIRRAVGSDDPFYAQKRRYSALALAMYPRLATLVRASERPFHTAARLAIAGNIIDLGAKSGLTEKEAFAAVDEAMHAPIEGDPAELEAAAHGARNILYLADNSGEIVLDRLLIEELPRERVTVAVRGAPIINDALIEDAEEAGLTRIVRVISNGDDAPGTLLQFATDEMREAFAAADLVISKGQGNYETVSAAPGRTVFYLLKVKCPVIAGDIGCPTGTMVIRRAG